MLRRHRGLRVLRVDREEEHVLVKEVVVLAAVPPAPRLDERFVRQVVVAGDVEERHLQLLHVPVELRPLGVEHLRLDRVPLDQVADRHHELGLEQVHLLHGAGEDLVAVPAGPVGDDDELELVRVGVWLEVRPRVLVFGGDLQVAAGGGLCDAGGRLLAGEDRGGDE